MPASVSMATMNVASATSAGRTRDAEFVTSLPTISSIGSVPPILLVSLRLAQGLALGGEYGGAATYVAEHSRPNERGYTTSYIQPTATLGFFLALLVIGLCRVYMDAKV